MPDTIERIIRRDLDQLPVLPPERWIPEPPGWPTVLGRGVKRAGLGALVLVLALAVGTAIAQIRAGVSGVPQVATQEQRTEPIARCSDGRPQSEIDFAGRMLWEPTANEISCVLNATVSGPGASRVYRLTDGRVLNMYERVEAVPVKPTVAPRLAERHVGPERLEWSRQVHSRRRQSHGDESAGQAERCNAPAAGRGAFGTRAIFAASRDWQHR